MSRIFVSLYNTTAIYTDYVTMGIYMRIDVYQVSLIVILNLNKLHQFHSIPLRSVIGHVPRIRYTGGVLSLKHFFEFIKRRRPWRGALLCILNARCRLYLGPCNRFLYIFIRGYWILGLENVYPCFHTLNTTDKLPVCEYTLSDYCACNRGVHSTDAWIHGHSKCLGACIQHRFLYVVLFNIDMT
jgi:hypothetical protein